MSLNNDIASKSKEKDNIMKQLAAINIQKADLSSAQLDKIKKISKVVMAVGALEKACLDRKNNIPVLNEAQKKSMMNYTSQNFFNPSGPDMK